MSPAWDGGLAFSSLVQQSPAIYHTRYRGAGRALFRPSPADGYLLGHLDGLALTRP